MAVKSISDRESIEKPGGHCTARNARVIDRVPNSQGSRAARKASDIQEDIERP